MQELGSERPAMLADLESRMWKTLFVISKGTKTAYEALTEFVQSISPSEIEAITKDERCRFWFRAGQSNLSPSTSGGDIDMEAPELRNSDTDMLPPPADQRHDPESELPTPPNALPQSPIPQTQPTPPPLNTGRDIERPEVPNPDTDMLPPPADEWRDPEPEPPTPPNVLPRSHIPQTQPTPPPPNTSRDSDREPSPSPSNPSHLAWQRDSVDPGDSRNGHPGQVPKSPPPNTQQESGEGSALPHPHGHNLRSRTAPRQPSPPPPPSKPNTGGGSQKKKDKVDVPEREETIVQKEISHYFVSGSPCSVPVPF